MPAARWPACCAARLAVSTRFDYGIRGNRSSKSRKTLLIGSVWLRAGLRCASSKQPFCSSFLRARGVLRASSRCRATGAGF